jgi:hypothetical protein
VGQTFLSKARNLVAVEVFLGPIPSNNVNVIFHLREAKQDIRTVTVNTSDLRFNQYYRFNFPEISDSDGKQFSFVIESPSSMFSDPLCVSYAIENLVNRPNVYSDGPAFKNGTQIRGVLSFRVLSETTLFEAFTDLYSRTSKDAAFFAAYLLILATLGVIFVQVRSGAQERFFSKRASDRWNLRG